jgi:hypothetical protein
MRVLPAPMCIQISLNCLLRLWKTGQQNPNFAKLYAKHYQTGKVIPDALIEKLQQASTFRSRICHHRIPSCILLDMHYHTMDRALHEDINAFEKDAMKKIGLIGRNYSALSKHLFWTHLSPEVIRQVITVTSGQACWTQMRSPHSRKPVCSIKPKLLPSANTYWKKEAQKTLWNCTLNSEVQNPHSAIVDKRGLN